MGNPVLGVLKISLTEQSFFDKHGYPEDMVAFWPTDPELDYSLKEGNYDPPMYASFLTKDWLRQVSASIGGRQALENQANLPDGFLKFFADSDLESLNPIYLNRVISVTPIPFGEKF